MITPILLSHDQTKPPIGFVEIIDGQIQFQFSNEAKITREQMFQIFGNPGALILEFVEEQGVVYIRRGRILEWSLSPPVFEPAVTHPAEQAMHKCLP